jgi:hypothetical protein
MEDRVREEQRRRKSLKSLRLYRVMMAEGVPDPRALAVAELLGKAVRMIAPPSPRPTPARLGRWQRGWAATAR